MYEQHLVAYIHPSLYNSNVEECAETIVNLHCVCA